MGDGSNHVGVAASKYHIFESAMLVRIYLAFVAYKDVFCGELALCTYAVAVAMMMQGEVVPTNGHAPLSCRR